MPAPDGPQFHSVDVPEASHDYAWEVSLRPDLDQEYTTKSGEPYIIPGHLHFDKDMNTYIASSLCTGRHKCPPATQAARLLIAMVHAAKYH